MVFSTGKPDIRGSSWSNPSMKKLAVFVIAFSLFIPIVPSASAHTVLTATNPQKGAMVKVAPTLVWLEFEDDLLIIDGKQSNLLAVTNSKKARVDLGKPIVDGTQISIKLKDNLPAGKYFVNYRVVSSDGHPVKGSYFFLYKPR